MMNTITEQKGIISKADAESAIKEIALYRKEIKRMRGETTKAIMLIRECAESEETEFKEKICKLESELKQFAEREADLSSETRSIQLTDGEIGFRKKIRYRSSNELRTLRSIDIHLKSLSKNDRDLFNTGINMKKKNLNRLSDETLKRLGIFRDIQEEFYYKIDGFKSY